MEAIIFSDVSNSIGFGRYAGPYRVATELRRHGFDTLVVDFFGELTLEEVKSILSEYVSIETLFVGFSTTLMAPPTHALDDKIYTNDFRSIVQWQSGVFPHSDEVMEEIFAYSKDLNSNVKIVVGGSKAHRVNMRSVDWLVWGEADASVVGLARHLKYGDPIKNHILKNGKMAILSEDYPYQFRSTDIFWNQGDRVFGGEVLPLEISRGCVFNCSFCTFKGRGKKVYEALRAPESLYNEIKYNYEKFSVSEYLFSDDTFNDSQVKVKEILKIKERLGFNLSFSAFCRLDMITRYPDFKTMLPDAGLKCVNFGIESFNEVALKRAHKYVYPIERLKQTLYELKSAWGNRVIITANFIVGLPGEKEDSVWRTAEWLSSKDCPIDSYNFLPLFIVPRREGIYDRTAILSNKLGDQSAAYGVSIDPVTGLWQHAEMNQRRAIELTNELEASALSRRTLVNRAGFYGRLRNIGVSLDECLSGGITKYGILEFIGFRRRLKDIYLQSLLDRKTDMPHIEQIFSRDHGK